MLPIQIHLRRFNPGRLIHLLVISIFFRGPALVYMRIYVIYIHIGVPQGQEYLATVKSFKIYLSYPYYFNCSKTFLLKPTSMSLVFFPVHRLCCFERMIAKYLFSLIIHYEQIL